MPGQESRYNVLIGMQVDPNPNATRAFASQIDTLLNEAKRLQNIKIGGGNVDLSALTRQVKEQIRQISTAQIESSPQFAARSRGANGRYESNPLRLPADVQSIITGAGGRSFSRTLSERWNAGVAQIVRNAVDQRAKLPLSADGSGPGFRTDTERRLAQGNAAAALNNADKALEAAEKTLAKELAAPAVAARKQQEELGRVNIALERRATAEAAATRATETSTARATLAINARTAAAERTAVNQAAADEAAITPRRYADPDLNTTQGKFQSGVNVAQDRLDTARNNLATALTAEGRTANGTRAAISAEEVARKNLARAEEALTALNRRAAEQAASSSSAVGAGAAGGGGGFFSQFHQGFQGRGENPRPYAEQIGQAVKFSVFYGAAYRLLSGVTETLQATLQEGIAFQQAYSELTLAAGRADENMSKLADDLGARSTEAGFAPSQGVLVGARALGLYGVAGPQADPNVQAQVADISARVVSRLAFSSGQQPEDLQTAIAAITNAFGGGAEAQVRVADLDAFFSQRFGVAPGQTIQAVSESATVGKAAGFDQEQVNAIAALLEGRTGQTASAVAGFMAQIFSRGGEGSLTGVASKFGIDPTLQLSEQVKELSAVYKTGTSQQKSEIAAAFGRGKVQNAATVLLSNFGDVQSAALEAKTGATGKGDQAFETRINNIGGQIQLTTAAFKEFANELGQSGFLDGVGAIVLVLRELAEAGTGALRLFSELPAPIKEVIAGLLLLAAASKVSAISGVAGGVGSAASGAFYRGLASRGTGIGGLAVGTAGAGAAALGELINPVTLAIGGLVAVGALKNTSDKLAKAQEQASAALDQQALAAGSSPDDYRNRSAFLSAAADDARASETGSFLGIPKLGGFLFSSQNSRLDSNADSLDAEAKRLAAVATAAENAASKVPPSQALITGFDSESLADSMKLITDSGGDARDRLKALADSINGTAGAAERAKASFDAGLFSGDNAAPLGDLIAKTFSGNLGGQLTAGLLQNAGQLATPDTNVPFIDTGTGKASSAGLKGFTSPGSGPLPAEFFSNYITSVLPPEVLQDGLKKALTDTGTTSTDQLGGKGARKLATSFLDQPGIKEAFSGLSPENLGVLRNRVTKYFQDQSKSLRELVKNGAILSDDQLTAYITEIEADTADLVNNLPTTDFVGRVAAQKGQIKKILDGIAADPNGATHGALIELQKARNGLVDAQLAQLENLRKVAQQNAGSAAGIKSVGRKFFGREVNAAVGGRDQDALVTLIGQAGKFGRDVAISAINEAIAAAKIALSYRQQIAALLGSFTGFQADNGDLLNLKGLKRAANNSITGDDASNVFDTGSDLPGYKAPTAHTAAETDDARRKAEALRSESPIAQARADLASAKETMNAAAKGSYDYYQALGQFYQAQSALTDAILAYRNNQFLLGHDATDPVVQANAALKAAQAKLKSDAGKGADVRAQDKVDLQSAQANQEAARFQKRLDAIQTAESLGKVSHARYIAYLDHEHDRLTSIKDRTYQQQQELNQIDGLLKDAANALNGQWNFGDIKLPTGYQVRRRVQELYGPDGQGRPATDPVYTNGSVSNHRTTINIDGADTAAVLRILREYVGGPTRTVTNRPAHR